MKKYLGKTLIVTNIVGAGGSIAGRKVKDSAPDGYTVFFSHWGAILNEVMEIGGFSLLDDFEICGICIMNKSLLMAGNATGKYKNMKEVMDDAKANPETVKFATEFGSVNHLIVSVLQNENNVKFHLIDTGAGTTRAAAALKGKQVDLSIFNYVGVKDYIESGDFINLGANDSERNPIYPEVPTLKEQGIKGLDDFEQKIYYFAFPKKTPKEIVDCFSEAMKKVAEDPEALAEFNKLYLNLTYVSPEDSLKYITSLKDTLEKYISMISKIE